MNDEEAGISCINCGYEKVVTNKCESDRLQKSLRWTENGSAICPECGNSVIYEDYITENSQRAQEVQQRPVWYGMDFATIQKEASDE